MSPSLAIGLSRTGSQSPRNGDTRAGRRDLGHLEEFSQGGGNLGRRLNRKNTDRPIEDVGQSELKHHAPRGAEPLYFLRTGIVLTHSDLIP